MRKPHVGRFLILFGLTLAVCGSALGETPREMLDRAVKLQGTKDDEKGLALIEQAIKQLETDAKNEPDKAETFFLLGRAYGMVGQPDKAMAYLDKAIKLSPENVEYLQAKGQLLADKGQLQEAERHFIRCLQLDARNVPCMVDLARVLAAQGKCDDAIAWCRRAIELEANNVDALMILGGQYAVTGNYAEAVETYRKVVQLKPEKSVAHHNLGQMYQNMGKHDLALKSFSRVVQLEPEYWKARTKVIQCHQALGNLKERDAARQELLKEYAAGKNPRLSRAEFFCREQVAAGKEKLMVFEYFEMKGEMAIRYSFCVLDSTGQKVEYKITLGSYDATNAIAHATGEVPEGVRLFHLDGYYPGRHATYAFYQGEPSYDDVRTRVIEIVRRATTTQPVRPLSGIRYAPETDEN